MPKTFIFTGSSKEALKHWTDTVVKGVSMDKISGYLQQDELKALRDHYGDKSARVWGAMPGSGSIRLWESMEEGDTVLAYSLGIFMFQFEVVLKVHNKELAKALWGTDNDGETWEYAYFLGGMKEIGISKEVMAGRLGYEPDWYPKGFSIISKKPPTGMKTGPGDNTGCIDLDKDPLEDVAEAEVDKELKDIDPEKLRGKLLADLKDAEVSGDLGSYVSLIERKKRDYRIVNKLKRLYGYRCQICGVALPISSGGYWIEAAHIKAKKKAGTEDPENLLILCPNHHKLFDHGNVTFDKDGKKVVNLAINGERLPVNYIEGYLE